MSNHVASSRKSQVGTMPGKQPPLEHYLRSLPAGQREITLSFEQVERILNQMLPPAAFIHHAWWTNNLGEAHLHAHAWLRAGWKVYAVDSTQKWVRFVRAAPLTAQK